MTELPLNEKILTRIRAHGYGSVFSISDFDDLADRDSISACFVELTNNHIISKIFQTELIYTYIDNQLSNNKVSSFDYLKVATALQRQHKWNIIPSKEYALYCANLTNKCSHELQFVTDGPDMVYENDEIKFILTHQEKPVLGKLSFKTELVLQIIYFMGKDNKNDSIKNSLSSKLLASEKIKILSEICVVQDIPSWALSELKNICKRRASNI